MKKATNKLINFIQNYFKFSIFALAFIFCYSYYAYSAIQYQAIRKAQKDCIRVMEMDNRHFRIVEQREMYYILDSIKKNNFQYLVMYGEQNKNDNSRKDTIK